MDKDELAAFLALLNGLFQKQEINRLSAEMRDERCRQINRYGVLSAQAIGAVIGCSSRVVNAAIAGMPKPTARGTLNPAHIPMLAYALSNGTINKEWLGILLSEGTSLSTVSDLTGIPESTLYRRKLK